MKQSFGARFENKFSKYAIRNLSMYMLICMAVGYVLDILPGTERILNMLTLEPGLILRGQVWRLVTWVINVPEKSNIFFVVISLYFYYSIGRTLENVWGDYRYNVYIFSGLIYTVIGAFCIYIITAVTGYYDFIQYMFGGHFIGYFFSTYYVCMSIFLAFAATFPEMEVLLMFILPIKVKYLGILYAVMMISQVLEAVSAWSEVGMGGMALLLYGVPVVASLLNFIIFFFTSRKRIGITRVQQKQRKEFRSKVDIAKRQITRHKCAICGKTDESHPNLEFRFCSKCKGNYEYCQDHLFTHKHIE